MGNTSSMHQSSASEPPAGVPMGDPNHRFKKLQEIEKGRQHSITSQLFPSRNTRHLPVNNSNQVQERGRPAQGPSVFKADYSIEGSQTRKSGSTESIRDDMAGLSLKNSNDRSTETPPFFSPGPAASTVQPTRQEALSVNDPGKRLETEDKANGNDQELTQTHRPSVVALMKSLHDKHEISRSPLRTETRSPSMDIYGALSLKLQSNGGDKSIESMNIIDDGYLQTEDVVLNQSLLQNVLKKDMKRKRSNNNGRTGKKNNISTNTSHEARLKVSSNSFSYESLESRSLPELKKPKSLSTAEVLPSFQSASLKNGRRVNDREPSFSHSHLGDNDFDRIDSFEEKSVEHREGGASRTPSVSSVSSDDSERVNVILKFRDQIDNETLCKIAIVSSDIISALDLHPPSTSGGLVMKYDESDHCWYVPDLALPPGIYKFQFLIDGFVRHSNFLPTATDSVGSIVNWFEVLPGYETIEPYRDQIDPANGPEYHTNGETQTFDNKGTNDGNNSRTDNNNGADQNSQDVLIAQPVPGRAVRPPLAGRHTSSYFNKQDRTGTPYSDYTGISRTSSAVRKSPYGHQTVSSVDLITALQPKKYEYSSEIPEIFKTGNILGQSDDNHPECPIAPPPLYEQSNIDNNIVDCDQDTLFAKLQQNGLLDAETAEQEFLDQYKIPDLPIYLNSTYLNKIFSEFQKDPCTGPADGINHIIPHVNLNHLLTSSIRDEMISVGCTTRYEGKFITQVVYAPCYYATRPTEQ